MQNKNGAVNAYEPSTNSSRAVRFIADKDEEETPLVNIGVDDRLSYIYGTYINQTVFPNEGISDLDGSQYVGDMIYEDFQLIIKDEQSDMAVRAHDPYFSWFMDNEKTYDELLESYIALAKQHPDSRYLMTNLSDNLKLYRSKEDVKKVYKELSEKYKNTDRASHIEQYLDSNQFVDEPLPRDNKGTKENIIQNASKHNLIIFSASWCLPCIEEIPLLKKVNSDLGEDLIFTYISMDQKSRITAFQNILKEHEIPWRTLYAYEDLKRIGKKYFAQTIPHNILVYPDGRMEFIDIRNQTDRKNLYALFGN